MRIVNVAGTGIFLLTADGPDHINTPDQVLELAAVGIPYAADKELPPATFARFFGRHTVEAAARSGVDYFELVAGVRGQLAGTAPEPLGCAAEDG